MLAFWSGLSPWHLLLVAAIALLFYGNRLPEVARSLGRAVNEFKRGLREVQDEIGKDEEDHPEPPRQKLQPPAKEARLEHGGEEEDLEAQSSQKQKETTEHREE